MSASAKQTAQIASLKGTLKALQRREAARSSRQKGPGNRSAGPSSSSTTFPGGSSHNNKRPYLLENDEFIENINSSIEFRVRSLSVNPGQSAVFPWLASMAKNFEKYRFEYLEFYYRPRVSGFAAAGQRGQVIMSFDYDAADPPPTDKQQMEATWPHKDDMPYKEIRLNLPIAELTGPGGKYVRPGLPPTGTDIKTYDAGLLHIATSGMDSLDAYIGELRVRYRAILLVPVLESTAVAHSKTIAVTYGGNDGVEGSFDMSMGHGFIGPNTLGVTSDPDGSIVLPNGEFWITVCIQVKNVDGGGNISVFKAQPILPASWRTEEYNDTAITFESAGVYSQSFCATYFFTSLASSDTAHYTNKFQLNAEISFGGGGTEADVSCQCSIQAC